MSELMQYEWSARFTAREKVALRYADAGRDGRRESVKRHGMGGDDAGMAQSVTSSCRPLIAARRWLKTGARRESGILIRMRRCGNG